MTTIAPKFRLHPELTLADSQPDPAQVFKVVNQYGLAVLPNYSQPDVLKALNLEFDQILDNGGQGIKPIDLDRGRGAIVSRLEIDSAKFPQTFSAFGVEFMQELSGLYWQKPVVPNEQVYVMNEVVGTTHLAQDLHFDVTPTFKFFLYLTDTTAENGAFSCVPGSQKVTAGLRQKYGKEIGYETRHLTRELPFREEEVVSVEGPAGTLIIFTTEVFHRAGVVQSGERRVMRGHTRPLAV